MSKRTVVLLSVGAGILIVAVVATGLRTMVKAYGRPNPASSTSAVHFAQGDAQMSDGGGVQMQVTYHPGPSTVVLQVSLNTHSVELGQFNLAKLSTLTLEPGGALGEAEWKPEGSGTGHHVTGTLTFKDPGGLLAHAKIVKLEIRDVAGVAVRPFEWKVGK